MEALRTLKHERHLGQEEFFAWLQRRPARDVNHYELIHGRIVMTPPADGFHGGIGANLVGLMAPLVRKLGLGQVFDSSTGYDLPSGDTLEPDVSFVSTERLRSSGPLVRGRFLRAVPELVVEILSRSTARRDRRVKKEIYEASGVLEYWLADPDRRTVTVFYRVGEAFDEGRAYASGIIGSRVLPQLEASVEDIFTLPV